MADAKVLAGTLTKCSEESAKTSASAVESQRSIVLQPSGHQLLAASRHGVSQVHLAQPIRIGHPDAVGGVRAIVQGTLQRRGTRFGVPM